MQLYLGFMKFLPQSKVGYRDPIFQQRLIRKFSLPLDARNVEVYSTLREEEGHRCFEGLLKWEVLENELAFNSLLGRQEPVTKVVECSRKLGTSEVDWIHQVAA